MSQRIYTELQQRGRQSISSLLNSTRLTSRQVRHGLVVLIQQNLIYHHLDNDSEITFYEVNHEMTFFLLRAGRVLEIVQSRHGRLARNVVQQLLVRGHTKISDLIAALRSSARVGDHNGYNAANNEVVHVNGKSKDNASFYQAPDSETLNDILTQLLEAGIIEPVVGNMFRSPADTFNAVEKETKQLEFGGSVRGPKKQSELQARTKIRVQELIADRGWSSAKSLKRPSNGVYANGSKRRKLANGNKKLNGVFHVDHHSPELDSNLIVRVNFEKCTMALRTQQMVALVEHDIGETTSKVYAELLTLLEEQIPRGRQIFPGEEGENFDSDPFVSALQLSTALDESVNLSWGIGKAPEDMINTESLERSRKRPLDDIEAAVEGDASSDEDEDDISGEDVDENGNIMGVDEDSEGQGEASFTDTPGAQSRRGKVTFESLPKPRSSGDSYNRIAEVKKHLLLLAEHPQQLVRRCGDGGGGQYSVDFSRIVDYMREHTVDTYIHQKFGRTGRRIARILKHRGKLDEKQIQKFGLLKQKDVRTKLVEMQMASFVDVQEVPRDANRTPARSIYLWYFDVERVNSIVLDKALKAIVRCFQVIDVERFVERDLLANSERTDVRGREEEMLEDDALKRWRVLRAKEEKLLTQAFRLDQLVGVFRDY